MAGLLLLYPHRWNIPTSLTKPNAINPIRYLLGIPLLGIIKKHEIVGQWEGLLLDLPH